MGLSGHSDFAKNESPKMILILENFPEKSEIAHVPGGGNY